MMSKAKNRMSLDYTQPILDPSAAKKVDFATNMPALLSHSVKNSVINLNAIISKTIKDSYKISTELSSSFNSNTLQKFGSPAM